MKTSYPPISRVCLFLGLLLVLLGQVADAQVGWSDEPVFPMTPSIMSAGRWYIAGGARWRQMQRVSVDKTGTSGGFSVPFGPGLPGYFGPGGNTPGYPQTPTGNLTDPPQGSGIWIYNNGYLNPTNPNQNGIFNSSHPTYNDPITQTVTDANGVSTTITVNPGDRAYNYLQSPVLGDLAWPYANPSTKAGAPTTLYGLYNQGFFYVANKNQFKDSSGTADAGTFDNVRYVRYTLRLNTTQTLPNQPPTLPPLLPQVSDDGFQSQAFDNWLWTPYLEIGIQTESMFDIFYSFSAFSFGNSFGKTVPAWLYPVAYSLVDTYPFTSDDPGNTKPNFSSVGIGYGLPPLSSGGTITNTGGTASNTGGTTTLTGGTASNTGGTATITGAGATISNTGGTASNTGGITTSTGGTTYIGAGANLSNAGGTTTLTGATGGTISNISGTASNTAGTTTLTGATGGTISNAGGTTSNTGGSPTITGGTVSITGGTTTNTGGIVTSAGGRLIQPPDGYVITGSVFSNANGNVILQPAPYPPNTAATIYSGTQTFTGGLLTKTANGVIISDGTTTNDSGTVGGISPNISVTGGITANTSGTLSQPMTATDKITGGTTTTTGGATGISGGTTTLTGGTTGIAGGTTSISGGTTSGTATGGTTGITGGTTSISSGTTSGTATGGTTGIVGGLNTSTGGTTLIDGGTLSTTGGTSGIAGGTSTVTGGTTGLSGGTTTATGSTNKAAGGTTVITGGTNTTTGGVDVPPPTYQLIPSTGSRQFYTDTSATQLATPQYVSENIFFDLKTTIFENRLAGRAKSSLGPYFGFTPELGVSMGGVTSLVYFRIATETKLTEVGNPTNVLYAWTGGQSDNQWSFGGFAGVDLRINLPNTFFGCSFDYSYMTDVRYSVQDIQCFINPGGRSLSFFWGLRF